VSSSNRKGDNVFTVQDLLDALAGVDPVLPVVRPGCEGETSGSDEKNERRCELIDKEIAGDLSDDERRELERLQGEMLAFRRQIAPLPLNDLRELHQELLRRAMDKAQ